LASWSDDIEQTYSELKIMLPDQVISKSRKPLDVVAKGWAVFNWGDESILKRLDSLFTSGLAEKWYNEIKAKDLHEYWNFLEKSIGKWRKLDLEHNFLVIFFGWLIGSSMSLTYFFLEFV
jgi:hypothetical protein